MLKQRQQNKRGQIVGGLIAGVGGIIVTVLIILLIVSTLNDAGLLTSGSEEALASSRLITNLTTGIDNVGNKIPTILKVAAIVILLGVIVLLVAQYKRANLGGTL